ncbi:MAG: hypothetical protein WC107_06730 [Patescibacteria group bacterium]
MFKNLLFFNLTDRQWEGLMSEVKTIYDSATDEGAYFAQAFDMGGMKNSEGSRTEMKVTYGIDNHTTFTFGNLQQGLGAQLGLKVELGVRQLMWARRIVRWMEKYQIGVASAVFLSDDEFGRAVSSDIACTRDMVRWSLKELVRRCVHAEACVRSLQISAPGHFQEVLGDGPFGPLLIRAAITATIKR